MTITSPQPPPGSNILVVDDVPENLQLLVHVLSDEGFRVRAAQSASQALVAARADPPELVLLDINMPTMNGYELCRQMKDDEDLCETPVIFVSALDATFNRVKAFEAGGVDYITKPFHVQEVIARVRTHVRLHRLQRERRAMIRQLQTALDEINTLKGFIPICANCKNIRNDEGYWERVEAYLTKHAHLEFTHSICPQCAEQLYPGFAHRHER